MLESIKDIISAAEIKFTYRLDVPNDWENVFKLTHYAPVAYTCAMIDYQLEYQRGHGGSWEDISLIAFSDNKPVAIWPLSISEKQNTSVLSSHGLPILSPIFVEACPKKTIKKVVGECLKIVCKIVKDRQITCWESGDSYQGTMGLSQWHLDKMNLGSSCDVKHELFLDLHLDMPSIRANFRKSYKPLINSGMRLWNVEILRERNESVWQEFRELHQYVSGRVTRSAETWDLQLQHIDNGHAFLVYLKNDSGSMVGGGLFYLTHDEGVYAVGAYDRDLFDKPLGHVVQFKAVEEMKARNVHWYKIGLRPFPADNPKPSGKEISIGEFKQGFSSHMFPVFVTSMTVEGDA